MKKRILSTVLTGALVLSFSIPAFASGGQMTDTSMKVLIDGRVAGGKGAPIMRNNRVLLPLRDIAAQLGVKPDDVDISWNASDKSAVIKKGETTVRVRVGSRDAQVGGGTVALSAAPTIGRNGKMYVPAVFFAQAFGKKVTWDAETHTLRIETGNKEKAVEVLKSFETGDPAAVEKWISPDKYIQHNLAFPTGRDTLIGAIGQLKGAGVKLEIKRVLEDGNYVVVHYQINLFGPKAVFDIFRFENGRIVEHWDNVQDMAGPNPSGHTMLDGATEITDLDKTKENKALVRKFYQEVLIDGNFAAMPGYYDGDNYIQHNPLFGDGLSTVMKAFQSMAQIGQPVAQPGGQAGQVSGQADGQSGQSAGQPGDQAGQPGVQADGQSGQAGDQPGDQAGQPGGQADGQSGQAGDQQADQPGSPTDAQSGAGKIRMVLGEGNFVLVVSEMNLFGTHNAVYDLFRVQNGKIAEHWDVIQEIPPKDQWQNGNGKF